MAVGNQNYTEIRTRTKNNEINCRHFTVNISFKVIFNLKYIYVGILDIASRWPTGCYSRHSKGATTF